MYILAIITVLLILYRLYNHRLFPVTGPCVIFNPYIIYVTVLIMSAYTYMYLCDIDIFCSYVELQNCALQQRL